MQPAVFLDRDGVIIKNRASYVLTWAEVEFYPEALHALVAISTSPYKIVIVTNQSPVGRGMMTMSTANDINERLVKTIEQHGGRIDGVFICPHAPREKCNCRKPKPGLIHQAAAALTLDLPRSILIGDAYSDLLAGQAAGIHQTALVLTGRGAAQIRKWKPRRLKPFLTFDSLSQALAALVPPGQL